ncbi:MAG: type II secretion system protein [Candidatus Gastranaerophilales bacterium]|nr:type II secretion system protein [Candidatus Gastranaerophilales bacterium]
MKQKSAFTLAEVMIVLVVIGVLSAILIPTAMKSKPDEAKMKFENTLSSIATTTREVVSSDEYFLDGDMSKKINGTSSTSINVCSAFANTLNFKTSNCNNTNSTTDTSNPDEDCANSSNKAQITTKNGVEYFFSSNVPFTNENSQKTICFDIDGIGKGEAPFGLKLRADGKITYGTRALTWSGSTPESVNTPSEENNGEVDCDLAQQQAGYIDGYNEANCDMVDIHEEYCVSLGNGWEFKRWGCVDRCWATIIGEGGVVLQEGGCDEVECSAPGAGRGFDSHCINPSCGNLKIHCDTGGDL